MATQTFRYSGIAKWSRLREDQLQEFVNDDGTSKGPFASISFSFDDKDEEKQFKSLKTRKEFKDDSEDGRSYITLRRYTENERFPSLGGLPKVFDSEGEPFSGNIGNGSKVTVKFEVYDTKSGRRGTRLIAVRVDDLVEWNPEDTATEDSPF